MAALQRTVGNVTLSHCGKGWVMQPALTPAKHNLKVRSREESFLLGKLFHNHLPSVFSTHFFFFSGIQSSRLSDPQAVLG